MLTVGELMTTDVHCLHAESTLLEAKRLMSTHRIRHIPIVDENGIFCGLITHRDILSVAVSRLADIDEATQYALDADVPVSEVMQRDVTVVTKGLSVRTAAETLLRNKFGCLPVLEDDRLIGILTESDFLKLVVTLIDALEEAR